MLECSRIETASHQCRVTSMSDESQKSHQSDVLQTLFLHLCHQFVTVAIRKHDTIATLQDRFHMNQNMRLK